MKPLSCSVISESDQRRKELNKIIQHLAGRLPDLNTDEGAPVVFSDSLSKLTSGEHKEAYVIFLADNHSDGLVALKRGAANYIRANDLSEESVEKALRLAANNLSEHKENALFTGSAGQENEAHDISSDRQKFRLAAKAAHLGLWEYDVAQNDLKWDELMFKIFGVDPATFKGTSEDWKNTLHPDDREKAISELERTIEMGLDFESQFKIVRTDNGETRYIRATAKSLVNEQGRVVKMIGLNWDITFMVRMQEKLYETNKRYELASRATEDAIWDWDILNGTIRWNSSFSDVFGHELTSNESTIEAWESWIHPDDRQRASESLRRAVESKKENWEENYRYLKKDGSYAHVYDRGFLVRDYLGNAVRMVGSMRDVTRMTEFVEALKSQNQKLKQIAWTQSHELRGPLTSIMSLIETARNDQKRELSKEVLLDKLEEATKNLDEVIHRIVSYTENPATDKTIEETANESG